MPCVILSALLMFAFAHFRENADKWPGPPPEFASVTKLDKDNGTIDCRTYHWIPVRESQTIEENGKRRKVTVLRHVCERRETTIPFNDVQVYNVHGRKLAPADAWKRLAVGAAILKSSNGEKVDPIHLRTVRQDTLILVVNDPGPGVIEEEPAEPPTPAAQEALLKKLATPSEHHRRFDVLAGKWALAVQWRTKPGDKWTESKGIAEYKWVLGRRFLLEEFKYDMDGEPLEWLGIYGYDNFQKRFTAVWVDNMGTNTEYAEGQYDPKGKVLSYTGEQDDPATGGKRKFKWIITVEGQDKVRFDSYDQDPPGMYFKNTEVIATRVRAPKRS